MVLHVCRSSSHLHPVMRCVKYQPSTTRTTPPNNDHKCAREIASSNLRVVPVMLLTVAVRKVFAFGTPGCANPCGACVSVWVSWVPIPISGAAPLCRTDLSSAPPFHLSRKLGLARHIVRVRLNLYCPVVCVIKDGQVVTPRFVAILICRLVSNRPSWVTHPLLDFISCHADE